MNLLLAAALFALLQPGPSGALQEQIRLKDAELRLLLAERNLAAAGAQVSAALRAGYRADSLRVRQRYARLAEPWRASERRSRAAALTRLRNVVVLYDDPLYGGDAMLRTAALELEDADERYAERMRFFEAALDAGDENVKEPAKDYLSALGTLQALLLRYPDAKHRDIALYLVGYAYQEMGDAAQALVAFERLLAGSAGNDLRTEVLVRIGDFYFDRDETPRAERFYRAALGSEGAWVDRALYKWAWALYKLNRYADAVSAFSRVVELGSARPDLQAEALQYLAVSYVEGFGYGGAITRITGRGARPYDDALIVRMADVLYDSTDFASAISAYTLAMRRNPTAPENLSLAQRIVTAYHHQRLIDEAVEARYRFYAMFAPASEWFARQDASERRMANEWSERILYEYATYHHYRELRDHPESRPLAEDAYRKYLSRFPGKPRAVQMGFYLAEILYDRDEYPVALSYYTRVAMSAPDPATDIASRSAYNMVLAAREMYRHDRRAVDELLTVSKRFADLRPTDERTPLVLYHAARLLCIEARRAACRDELSRLLELYPRNELASEAVRTVIDSYAEENRYGELAAWADRLLERGRIIDADTRRFVLEMVGGAMFQDALAQERSGKRADAASRYLAVYERYPLTPAGQTALYNAAFGLEREHRYLEALDLYRKLLIQHPRAGFAARAAFRRGQIFENAANYAAAVSAYALVVERYPRAAEAKESLFNVAALLAMLGRHADAALQFERHYGIYGAATTEPEDTLLRAAVQWEAAGNLDRARFLFGAFARLPQTTGQSGYAALRTAMLTTGRPRGEWIRAGLAHVAKLPGGDPGVTAALRFESAEDLRVAYLGHGLPPDLKKALKALNRKAAALKDLQAAYTAVVAAGDPEYAVAALYRIGEAYAAFADMLYNAPPPAELNAEEADIYRAELEGQAAPIEDKALEAFRKAEARAGKNGRETKWTALIRRSLNDKPSPVRILTNRLEPLFAPARHGLMPPAVLALRDEAFRSSEPTAAHSSHDLRVADGRLRMLLRDSIRKQRVFFHAERPYLDTGGLHAR